MIESTACCYSERYHAVVVFRGSHLAYNLSHSRVELNSHSPCGGPCAAGLMTMGVIQVWLEQATRIRLKLGSAASQRNRSTMFDGCRTCIISHLKLLCDCGCWCRLDGPQRRRCCRRVTVFWWRSSMSLPDAWMRTKATHHNELVLSMSIENLRETRIVPPSLFFREATACCSSIC
jgi:hypothetical protein